MNTTLIELSLVQSCDDRHNKSALLYHAVRTRQGLLADRIQHHINIFREVLELLFLVIDADVGSESFEQILICCRRRRQHFRAARLCDLDRESSYASGSAMNKHRLARF